MMERWVGHAFVAFMRVLAYLPLPLLRALGWVLGWVLYALAVSRRRVVLINLRLCFPTWSERQRVQLARRSMVLFAQSWLDRAWLWHARPEVVKSRLRVVGHVQALLGDVPTIVFAPHFYGLDAGWTALTLHTTRHCNGIYAHQANAVIDRWIFQGRSRFGSPGHASRQDSTKALASALRQGELLYILPDTNHGAAQVDFVPFYGVPAATSTSLPRFARMGRAQVVPMVTRLTPDGYEVQVLAPWDNYPSGDDLADTALMNQRLARWIDTMPEQYWWVAKRFKRRPAGEPEIY